MSQLAVDPTPGERRNQAGMISTTYRASMPQSLDSASRVNRALDPVAGELGDMSVCCHPRAQLAV